MEQEKMMVQEPHTHLNQLQVSKEKRIIVSVKSARVYKTLFGISVVINICLVVILVCVIKNKQLEQSPTSESSVQCSGDVVQTKSLTDLGRAESALYGDLSEMEMQLVIAFLFTQKNVTLVPLEAAQPHSGIIQSIELHPPDKTDVLKYISGEIMLPLRYAKVTVQNANSGDKILETYKVGPLIGHSDSITMEKVSNPTSTVSSRVQQVSIFEFLQVYETIARHTDLLNILEESYGATLFKCIHGNEHRCLIAYQYYLPTSSSNERKIWMAFYYDVEYYTLYPVDMQILMNVNSSDLNDWTIERVWYGKNLYNSYDDFVKAYYDNSIPKMSLSFPSDSEQKRGSLNIPADKINKDTRRGPVQFEPDGKRYSIADQTMEYQRWRFTWQNTLLTGPVLNNVEFDNETIVYELGLQDIVVLYTGDDPLFSQAAFADGFSTLGTKTAGLVPGVDCPEHATFINITVISEGFLTHDEIPNAICVFEHNTGLPLRRHYSNAMGQGGTFYGGLVANVLIFRTIFVVNNYDYIMDYQFYENGAIEVKIYPTGYVLTSYAFDNSMEYGYHIGDNTIAPYHLHLFHFKVDIDVLGSNNRYKTVDISVENVTSPEQNGGNQYRYKLKESLKTHELDAAIRTNQKDAKYHLFYSEDKKNKYGHHRAFQIQSKSSVEQLFPDNYGFEKTIPWSRYKMAVTKRKETEDRSSSAHASLDAGEPVVNFQKFLQDNESIVDEDLVAWVTLGMHHIPHTEDIPNTATTGRELSFIIKPFNYHNEDPSMTSQNAVRITPKAENDGDNVELEIERYGTKEGYNCPPKEYNFDALKSDGAMIFPSYGEQFNF